jgi:hypothetical protein
MPVKFDGLTPVVDFQAILPRGAKHREWLLWPALACKVSLPQRRPSPLNVFQLAALRLCQAGVRTPAQIESRLALPQELLALVLDQLRARGLVDAAHAPTAAGQRLLAGEEAPEPVAETGYVLIDSLSGALWPHLHRGSLPFVDAASTGNPDKVEFARGALGDGHRVKARFIRPRGTVEEPHPSPRELRRTAQRYAKRLRAYAPERRAAAAAEAAQALLPGQRVRLLGTAPEPVYVAVCLFHISGSEQQAWLATDPCGFGDGRVLRDAITRMARENDFGLRRILQKLSGDAWHVDESELAHTVLQARLQALQRVRGRCGAALDLLPPRLLELLSDADRRLEDVPRGGAAATRRIEDFVGIAYESVESLFGWMVRLYPDRALLQALLQDAQPNVTRLAGIAAGLGLDVPREAMFLLAVKRSAVKGAIVDGNVKLQPCLAACLLAAHGQPRHPLRVLAARQPQALTFLARLNQARNAGAHDGRALPTLAQAQALDAGLYALLRGMFGVPEAESPAAASTQAFTDVALRIRARAEHDAQSCLGIEAFPDVLVRLVDLFESLIQARTLAATPNAGPLIPGSLRDVSVRATIVLEAAVRELERVAPAGRLSGGISHYDRRANAALAIEAARAAGFALDQAGGLPQELTHANPKGIRIGARGGTLSSRVLVLLLAVPEPAEPVRQLARESPSWLLDVGGVVQLRGHGDTDGLDASHIEPLHAMTIRALQAVLDVLN